MENIKKTPLCEEHIKLGARMVDFAGWYMPVQYKGVIEEHECVRKNVGLFDVSHMGEIFVKGPKALETLQWLTTNDVSVLNNGQAQYNLLPNPEGGLVDDIYIYCIEKNNNYLVCVNASNSDKDYAWMKQNSKGAEIANESSQWAQVAIQGPKADDLLKDVLKNIDLPGQKNSFVIHDGWIIARTGYTGENGFEIFLPNDKVVKFWQELIKKGEKYLAQPIGLGARDTLRTEMKFSLYGHEIDDRTNIFEAGLGWVVKMQKGDFIGRAALEVAKNAGPQQKLVGFKLIDKGIARAEYPLFSFDNKPIGRVTSGTMSPTLKEPIGIGYVTVDHAEIGKEFFVQIRGRNCKAVVVKTPFVNIQK